MCILLFTLPAFPSQDFHLFSRTQINIMIQINRRDILKSLAGLAVTAPLAACSSTKAITSEDTSLKKPTSVTKQKKHNPIGTSTYSFWRFNGKRDAVSMEYCIEQSARMGFDGVELLLIQMTSEENAYLQKIKRLALHAGLDLYGFSTHQGYVRPDKEYRDENIAKTIHQLELAYQLGIPTMRLNTGRWGTSESFDALMANKGIEPPIDGYTEEDGFQWVIDSIEKCLPTAEKCGVVMGLENHWGIGRTAEAVVRIVEEINSPWLQITLDTGNFLEDQYRQYELMAAKTVLVQAKTYYGGGKWYSLDIDYAKVGEMMRRHDYKGYISLEYEGKGDALVECPKSLEMLRQHFWREIES